MSKILITLIALLTIVNVNATSSKAKESKVTQADIESLVTDFYINQRKEKKEVKPIFSFADLIWTSKKKEKPLKRDCEDDNRRDRPTRESCIDIVCSKVGVDNCTHTFQLENIAKMCRGVHRPSCIKSVCSKIGVDNCTHTFQLENIAKSCKGYINSNCIDSICSKIGVGNCAHTFQLENIVKVCKNTKINCVNTICSKIGVDSCNHLFQIENIAKTCSGQNND